MSAMKKEDSFEDIMFQYMDRLKILFYPEQWNNLILNCSKNEIFILLLIYRKGEVNMTEIADYINTPLNTATGIISRMETRGIIKRERNTDDKRVVTVCMTEDGKSLMQDMLCEFVNFGQKVMNELQPEETQLLLRIADKVIDSLQQESQKTKSTSDGEKKAKRILIQ